MIMDKHNIRLDLMYDGTAYHGFQRQKNAYTVQESIENAIFEITGERAALTGCGRTDAGVHARGYVANFFTSSRIKCEKLPIALNSKLAADVRIKGAREVPADFHARFSARSKTYTYTIINEAVCDVFMRRYSWFYPIALDFDEMRKAAEHIMGERDFAAFMAAGSPVSSTVRTVRDLTLKKDGGCITMEITADGFLYNMVRIIMGTLVYAGNGKIKSGDIPEILEKRERKNAGITAPPEGLCMKCVEY